MENKSLEQLMESCIREIREKRGKILEDFSLAYISHLIEKDPEISLDDICLVEYQCDGSTSFNRKYWFEYKPKLPSNSNEWISVKDKLPEKTGRYLVFSKRQISREDKPRFRVNIIRWEEYGDYPNYEYNWHGNEKVKRKEILYWMPIPDLPKE